MTDQLTDLPRVGPEIAENLRANGFETKRSVLEADPDDLAEVKGIGFTSARQIAGEKPVNSGVDSKFEDVKDDILAAARGEDGVGASEFLNIKQIAHAGGVSEATLYRYLERHDEFRKRFTRARQHAASQLTARALNPDTEVDTSFVRFLLERCFSFIKTEEHQIRLDDDADLPDKKTHAEFVTYGEE